MADDNRFGENCGLEARRERSNVPFLFTDAAVQGEPYENNVKAVDSVLQGDVNDLDANGVENGNVAGYMYAGAPISQ